MLIPMLIVLVVLVLAAAGYRASIERLKRKQQDQATSYDKRS